MSLGIIDFVKKAWTLTMTVIDDDTNRWENQMAALTEFLKRYSWTPNTEIKKGAVIYCPFGLNERLIAQNDGVTGEVEPTWNSYREQGQITDGTVVWAIEAPYFKQEVNVAIGTIIQQPWTSAPPGFVAIHDGPVLQRAQYPKLWEFVSKYCSVVTETEWQKRAAMNESVGVFSLGDGSTTFRCPKMLSFARGCAPINSGMYYADQNKAHNHNGKISGTISTIDTIQSSLYLVGQNTNASVPSSGWSGYVCTGDHPDGGRDTSIRVNSSIKNFAISNEEDSGGSDEVLVKNITWPYYLRVDDL